MKRVYCETCESMVARDLHSCHDVNRARRVEALEREVVEKAEAYVERRQQYHRIMSGEHDGPYLGRLQDADEALTDAVRALRAERGS